MDTNTKTQLRCYGIPGNLVSCDFSNFRINSNNTDAAISCRLFAFSKLTKGQGLIISGPPNSGKSHLAVATLRNIVLSYKRQPIQESTLYISARQFLKIRSLDSQSIEKSPLLRNAYECQLLLLEDFGSEISSEWSFGELLYLISSRYNNLLRTIITSRLSPNDIFSHYFRKAINPLSVDKLLFRFDSGYCSTTILGC